MRRRFAPPSPRCPLFHLTPPVGWLNDPNGFSAYWGEYHLFYQYHPYSTSWGPMHWGHCKSRDLLRWEYLPAALAPDQPYDRDGCFSGSAAETLDGRHVLLYTGVRKQEGREYQTQCAAVGDGLNYEKLPANPVITGAQLPPPAAAPRTSGARSSGGRAPGGSRPSSFGQTTISSPWTAPARDFRAARPTGEPSPSGTGPGSWTCV